MHKSDIAVDVPISIHAPARGATFEGAMRGMRNPFQSTLPRGERQCKKSNL